MTTTLEDQQAFDIVIVAPNSAVDSLYVVRGFEVGSVNRAVQAWHTAGGKGNNMARAVVKLRGRVLSLGIVGGTSGQLIARELAREGIVADLAWASAETRRCSTISHTGATRQTTVVLEPGGPVGAEARESLFDKVLKYADRTPFLTLNGSLPPDFPQDYYAQLITRLKTVPVRIAVDCAGEPLRLSAQACPWLIKVNLQEFQEVFAAGRPWHWQIAADVFHSLQPNGLAHLIITEGKQGAWVFSTDAPPFRVFTEAATVISTAGAGDAFLAGLLLALQRGQQIEGAARYAAAAAAASLQQIICGALEMRDVEHFLRLTEIEQDPSRKSLAVSYRPRDKPRLAIAVDVGGTSIKAGVIRADGQLLVMDRRQTLARASPELIAQTILTLVTHLCDHSELPLKEVEGVGISIAAFITANGVVTATAHLSQDWIGYDLNARLARDLPANYYFALDTPAPTLGEAYYGAGKGVPDCVYVTVSTGIGAGIMAGGKYFVGGLGWAGGVGHTIIDETSARVCNGCGNAGCLETFAATQGLLTTTRELLQQDPRSLVLTLAQGDVNAITPQIVFQAAQQRDSTACAVWRAVGHALGIGLNNLIDIVSPRRIIIGGGIAQAGDYLLEPARTVIRDRAFPPRHRRADVVQAALGDLSGVFGAAAMVFHDLRINPPMETLEGNL